MEILSLISKLIGSSLLALLLLAMVYLSFSVTQRLFGKQVLSFTISTFTLLTLVSISLLILNRQLNNSQLTPTGFLSLGKIASELIISVIMVVAFIGTRLLMQTTQNLLKQQILPLALRQSLKFRQTYRNYEQIHFQTLSIMGDSYKEKHPLFESFILPRLIESYLTSRQLIPVASTEYIVFYKEGDFKNKPIAIPTELLHGRDLKKFENGSLNVVGNATQKATLIFRQLQIERRKSPR